MNRTPLVDRPGDAPFALWAGREIRVDQFCADVYALAEALPDGAHLINLVSDRYVFTVAFFAALSRGQTVLLPAQREPALAAEQLAGYGTACALTDTHPVVQAFAPAENGVATSPDCERDHTAVVVFTSGSTGTPQPHAKTWGLLDRFRRQHAQLLDATAGDAGGILATVPSWHMYGLEWAMLLPTVAPVAVYCGADFYPQDVAAGLAALPSPVLVSTPVHLRALRALPVAPRNVRLVMSATAPLEPQAAGHIEARYGAKLLEIYGCSEIGTVAHRLTAASLEWQFFTDFAAVWQDDRVTLSHPELPQPVELADELSPVQADRFLLKGRRGDIVKIAGKRESLANLNAQLLGVPGVQDGVFVQPPQGGDRLAAFVVAPDMSSAQLRRELAQRIPSAFMPRPLKRVASLPRDKTGKLKASDLQHLLAVAESGK